MTQVAIGASFPRLYEPILPELFRREVPEESLATCASCAMCETGSGPRPAGSTSRFFNPETKCCTYHPRLPNYLAGAILADATAPMAEGRQRLRAKLAARTGVTPQWLRAPAKYDLLYGAGRQAFGRAQSLACPYYGMEKGECTIWPYREAVCSTFFCKYVTGADGRDLWMSVKRYLSLVEAQLSRHALLMVEPELLLRLGDTPAKPDGTLGPSDLDDGPPPAADYDALWGAWAGREAELYQGCYEVVRELTPETLERIMGLDGDIHLRVLDRLHTRTVTTELPLTLRLNPDLTVRPQPDGSVALAFHSEYDALALPGAAFHLLGLFDGKTVTAEVRRRLREEHQADFADELLLALARHRILL